MTSLCDLCGIAIETLRAISHLQGYPLEGIMFDIIFVLLGLGLFGLASAYVRFCAKL